MFAYRSILREPPRPAAVRENPRAPWLAVGIVCFGAFMGQLDASIVTIKMNGFTTPPSTLSYSIFGFSSVTVSVL